MKNALRNKSTLNVLRNVGNAKLLDESLRHIDRIKKIAVKSAKIKTPCYLFDEVGVEKSFYRFKQAFSKVGLKPEIFFAVKSNPSIKLIQTLSKLGVGADVSSVQELAIAIKAGSKSIIVTGPGKTTESLKKFIRTKSVKNLYLDSVHEYDKLQVLINNSLRPANPKINFGLRILPPSLTSWDKFGVTLDVARKIILHSYENKSAFKITALQFHISYVISGKIFEKALKEVSAWVKTLPLSIRSSINILDIGGGFTPQTLEGAYPWNKKQISLFDVEPLKNKINKATWNNRASFSKVSPIEEVAKKISTSFSKLIKPLLPNVKLNVEPGRFLSTNSMHILLTVVDKKSNDSVILDGGWNMLGWEKYQYINYCPVFNISNWNPKKEFPMLMYGNLCLPDDIWGYYLHGNKVEIGDKILIPFQGAYTFTYRQEFIRGIPSVFVISAY